MQLFHKISELSNQGIPLVVISVTEKKGEGPVDVGKKMILTKDLQAFGTVGGGALEHHAYELAKTMFTTRKSITKTYLLNEGKVVDDMTTLPMSCGGVVTLFYEYIGPQEQVYIFGAGHVGQALCTILKTMNFHVTVIDHRPEVVDSFTGADELILSGYVEYVEQDHIAPKSFVVVTTPSHKFDFVVLREIFKKQLNLPYMGMICSLKKLEDFLQYMKEELGKDVDLQHLYAPIGLDIGGGSPEEIAISVAAEMLAVSYQKTGQKHMRNRVKKASQYWHQ